jgi:hypothetical protein
MQLFVLLSQQPPPEQELPSQHGWPAPPHATHCLFPPHVRPAPVQKSEPPPRPGQHCWPAAPHGVPPFAQLPFVQVPRVPAHGVPVAWHFPALQHDDAAPHASFWQHGWVAAPHGTDVPLEHTVVPEVRSCPEATHLFDGLQHAPPPHVLPAQQSWPGPPHCTHFPPVHAPPSEHVCAAAMQRLVPGSQQPVPLHVAFAQHGSPGPPHA